MHTWKWNESDPILHAHWKCEACNFICWMPRYDLPDPHLLIDVWDPVDHIEASLTCDEVIVYKVMIE